MTSLPTTTALTDANLRSSPVAPDSIPEVCRDVPFMTSLEIAEVLGMRHDNVMRDIERRLANVKEDVLKFEGIYRDSMNRSRRCYCLPGKYLLFITTAYDDVGRMGLIEHWEAVNEGWIKPQQGVVNHVVERLVNGGRKARMVELQEAEERAMLSGRRLTAKERNFILLP